MIAGRGKANSGHPLLVLPIYGYTLENGKVVLNGAVAERDKMTLLVLKAVIVENDRDRGRMFLLMLTHDGFGGAAAVIAAKEIVASASSGGTAFMLAKWRRDIAARPPTDSLPTHANALR